MNDIIVSVIRFLWETVWRELKLRQFLKLNTHYVILMTSNIALSLLFVYMTEQTITRTTQYREAKDIIASKTGQIKSLKNEVDAQNREMETVMKAFGMKKVKVNTDEMLEEYASWAEEVRRLEAEISKASTRLGAQHETN